MPSTSATLPSGFVLRDTTSISIPRVPLDSHGRKAPPPYVDRQQAVELLVALDPSLGPSQNIEILSLAPGVSPWETSLTQMATVFFLSLPPTFDNDTTSWDLPHRKRGLQRDVIADIDFLDFTVLNSSTMDGDQLPNNFHGLRAICYGFDTKVNGHDSFQDVNDLAAALVRRLRDVGRASSSARPLLFLAHSLRGIVLKRALLLLAGGIDTDRAVLSTVKAILFFGVPNKGMHIDNLLSVTEGNPLQETIIRQLGSHSDYVLVLEHNCHEVELLKRIRVISAYETKETRMIQPTPAIHSSSDVCDRNPINKAHSNMMKFSPSDENYERIASCLLDVFDWVLIHVQMAIFLTMASLPSRIYGMGIDNTGFLSTLGAVTSGDLTKWSIGGPPGGSLLGGLLSPPQGLWYSHNKYEKDTSVGGGDMYTTKGDAHTLQIENFQALYDLQKDAADPNYNVAVFNQHHANQWDKSLATNPYFFYGPFTGIAVSTAGHAFAANLFANHSAESPDGLLNKEVLKSFFGVTGSDNSLRVLPGQERIPNNWYRRSNLVGYAFQDLAADTIAGILAHPQLGSIGGNVGKTNSFIGVNLADFTGGILNSAQLLQGNNLICFVMNFATQCQPDILNGVFSDPSKATGLLDEVLASVLSGLNCPQSIEFDNSLLKKFPGYSKLNSNGICSLIAWSTRGCRHMSMLNQRVFAKQ
ncbi:hypothetical protein FH972_021572 [Carpinus fangiana]|uniref:Heme haloperoxidase family profile domain-containing protein n=1 Tax=Carpinus fangiana TaxID=176857 RepID=A0A5N6KPQ5_9ROSI|nr:hypothetical protein FH972_021572 [Carpinus fangiana]